MLRWSASSTTAAVETRICPYEGANHAGRGYAVVVLSVGQCFEGLSAASWAANESFLLFCRNDWNHWFSALEQGSRAPGRDAAAERPEKFQRQGWAYVISTAGASCPVGPGQAARALLVVFGSTTSGSKTFRSKVLVVEPGTSSACR